MIILEFIAPEEGTHSVSDTFSLKVLLSKRHLFLPQNRKSEHFFTYHSRGGSDGGQEEQAL